MKAIDLFIPLFASITFTIAASAFAGQSIGLLYYIGALFWAYLFCREVVAGVKVWISEAKKKGGDVD